MVASFKNPPVKHNLTLRQVCKFAWSQLNHMSNTNGYNQVHHIILKCRKVQIEYDLNYSIQAGYHMENILYITDSAMTEVSQFHVKVDSFFHHNMLFLTLYCNKLGNIIIQINNLVQELTNNHAFEACSSFYSN